MSAEPDAESDGRPPRPEALSVNYTGVPVTLKDRDTWVCWRHKRRDGEWTKVPVDPQDGGLASPTDPETWESFDTARAYHEDPDTGSDGLGYVFDPEDTVVGVDIDDARNPKSGRPNDTAKDIVQSLDSFTEVSPSGTGYHVYIKGILPDDAKNRTGKVEIYDSKRFFTVTGHHVDTTPATVERRNDALQRVHSEHVADDTGGESASQGRENTASGSVDTSDLSDEKILEKAKSAEYGDEFAALWRGDTSGYESHSEADYHLCRHLLFWTGGDRTQTTRLFSRSALTREKWDAREDYRERTMNAADDSLSSYYDPSKGDQGPGHATPPEWAKESSDTVQVLTPSRVANAAGVRPGEEETLADAIASISDREKAAIVWSLLKESEEFHVRVHRGNGELYAYSGDVWIPDGERALRHAGRQALGSTNYGSNVLTELESQAKADPVVEVSGDTFGLSPGVLAVENGLLDLEKAAAGESGAIRPLEPEDYALTKLPVEYAPDADADEWHTFVGEVVEPEKIQAFQEYVGYTLHRGAMPINRALLLVGDGANGKSTALNVVRAMLGEEHTRSKAIHDFAEANHIADLHGAIANIHADLSEGALSAKGISKFKGLTGGDTMEGRRLYQESFEFQPTAKHLYAANTTPDVSNYVDADDSAWWRRWLVVHFPRYFPPSERDHSLEARLTSDESLSGVLNWAIEGWDRLMDHGRFTNEDIEGATRERWVTWGENVDHFIEECVERNPDAENLSTGEAYDVYTAWCRANGEDPIGQRQFTRTLRDTTTNVGYAKRVRPHGTGTPTNGYKALGFTDDAPDVDTVLSDDAETSGETTQNQLDDDHGGDA